MRSGLTHLVFFFQNHFNINKIASLLKMLYIVCSLTEAFKISEFIGLFGLVFENIENIILVFSRNCYCFLNLMYFVFVKKKMTQTLYTYSSFSRIKNGFQKLE